MSIIRRLGTPYFWTEFQFEGTRYRQTTRTTNRRKAEAFERRLRQQIYDRVKLGHVDPTPMRFNDAVRRYTTTHLLAKSNQPRTAKAEAYLLGRLQALIGDATLLHDITAAVIWSMKETLLIGGSKPATVNRYLATLRAILRMACNEWGTLVRVPPIKLYRLDNERTRWLREDEEQRLLDACGATPNLHDLVVFLLDTGCRLREATALCWLDVDLPERGRGSVRLMVTKSRRPRGVPLPRRTDELLRALHARRPADEDRVFLVQTVGCRWRGTVPQAKPFANPHGAWRRAVRRAGLHDVRMHDLRHTYASRLVQRGVPLMAVSQLLGHASLKMTMRYAHLSSETLRDAVDRLDGERAA